MNGTEITQTMTDDLIAKAKLLANSVLIVWGVWLVNTLLLNRSLNRLGIRPLTARGLVGIAVAPFLHSNAKHLIGNTTTFLVLGGLVLITGTDNFYIVTIGTAVTSGLGIWLFGGIHTLHIGASGVLFGYLGFLFLRGYVEREVLAAFLSVVVFYFYGSRLWQILPHKEKFSWEGHLFGLLGGALIACYLDAIKIQWSRFF